MLQLTSPNDTAPVRAFSPVALDHDGLYIAALTAMDVLASHWRDDDARNSYLRRLLAEHGFEANAAPMLRDGFGEWWTLPGMVARHLLQSRRSLEPDVGGWLVDQLARDRHDEASLAWVLAALLLPASPPPRSAPPPTDEPTLWDDSLSRLGTLLSHRRSDEVGTIIQAALQHLRRAYEACSDADERRRWHRHLLAWLDGGGPQLPILLGDAALGSQALFDFAAQVCAFEWRMAERIPQGSRGQAPALPQVLAGRPIPSTELQQARARCIAKCLSVSSARDVDAAESWSSLAALRMAAIAFADEPATSTLPAALMDFVPTVMREMGRLEAVADGVAASGSSGFHSPIAKAQESTLKELTALRHRLSVVDISAAMPSEGHGKRARRRF